MSLIPFPSRMFRPTHGSMDRWFDDMLQENDVSARGCYPATDISEDDGAFTLKTDLPDVDAKRIEISIQANDLTFKGERSSETEEDRDNYHRIERVKGAFSRTFSLPEAVDADAISAAYDKGVLTIKIPKQATESSTPRTVKVA